MGGTVSVPCTCRLEETTRTILQLNKTIPKRPNGGSSQSGATAVKLGRLLALLYLHKTQFR